MQRLTPRLLLFFALVGNLIPLALAQATSPISGELICPSPVTPSCSLDIPPGLSPVDHDQRNTLNVGFNTTLPWHAYASSNVYYGSGFTNGLPGVQYPGNYLPATLHSISLSARPSRRNIQSQ
jgi:hypothetical protein